uniref:Globin family profile domain-containing protein n=1 Tax=Trichuris muris TaxID=70415 RepID=A0A5S6Q1R4_TRIMR
MLSNVLVALLALSFAAVGTYASSASIVKDQVSRIEVNEENGGKLYETFFTVKPEFHKFFDLQHAPEGKDIVHNQRFKTLGKLFLEKFKRIVMACEDEEKLKEELKGLKLDHDPRHVGLTELKGAKPILLKFMEQQVGMNDEQKKAWAEMFKKFETVYSSLH